MPRHPSFSPTFDKERNRWVLSIPSKFSESGKRKRKVFETEETAKAYAKKIRNSTEATRKAFDRAGPELIRDAVNYDELFRELYGFQGGLKEACETFMKRLDEESRATRFSELVEAYEEQYSGDWTSAYKTKWSWFKGAVEPLWESITLSLNGSFWVDWIRERSIEKGWSDSTANELLSKLRSVYKHGIALSLVDRNPLEGIRRKKIRRIEKAVYTVGEVKAIMNCAWEHDREMVPFYGLAIFAGLRPGPNSEIENLLWEDIDFSKGHICVAKRFDNKTAHRRFVDIEDNLLEWLEPWKEATGKVTPVNLTNRRRWIVKGKHLASENAPESEWKEIARNGLEFRDITRHTYGSFLDAKYRDRNKVKEFMGHRNFETYDQHYRNAQKPQDAEKFWSIYPPE